MADFSQARQNAWAPAQLRIDEVQQIPDSDAVVPETQLEDSATSHHVEFEAGELDPETQATLDKCAVGPPASVSAFSQTEHPLPQIGGFVRPESAKTADLTSRFTFAKPSANRTPPQQIAPVDQAPASPGVSIAPTEISKDIRKQRGMRGFAGMSSILRMF